MPSMDFCLQICVFGLSLFLFPVAFGCIDGKHFTSSSDLVCKPSLVIKLANLEGNSIKHPKVELTIQIYIIKPSWSSGMNFGHFMIHYSKLCSKSKIKYLYTKTRKEKAKRYFESCCKLWNAENEINGVTI